MPTPPDLPKAFVEMFNAFKQIPWLLQLVAIVEIIGGLLLMVPKSSALGVLILLPIMTGMVINHIYLKDKNPFP